MEETQNDTQNHQNDTQNPDEEPTAKKPRMSSSSDEQNHQNDAGNPTRPPRYKRRKVAILLAYCGVGYQGMQKNPGARTIEGDLEEALYRCGAVPEHDRGCPKRYDWARSARTDKGVSAVGQVVSGRFYVDPPGFVERVNGHLNEQFRVFGYKRVTASFSAKKFCDKRRYVYLIPVFALDPSCHRDRESVLASLGSENELAKCFECSERGRKVIGVMGKHSSEPKTGGSEVLSIQSNDTLNGGNTLSRSVIAEDATVSLSVEIDNISSSKLAAQENNKDVSSDGPVNLENSACNNLDANNLSLEEEHTVEAEVNGFSNGGIDSESSKGSGFCYGDKERERFNRILKQYEGTHNYHNFTTRIKPEDPSARRYIISFHANTVVTVDGMEFVKCEVVGQSFMLHQIRKMIGVAVAIMRNVAPATFIESALKQNVSYTVPTAPEVGLYLDECFFTSYNQKWKDSHEEVSMKDYEEEAEDFKMKHIYTHIASTEKKEGTVAVWLHSLNCRNYPDLCMVNQGEITDTKEAEENEEMTG